MRHFSHHIGDYAAATAHLPFLEDAAYHRLLRRYYQDEKPLPADVAQVQRLAGARTEEERAAVEVVLREFFVLGADGWRQGRADKEITGYQERAEIARKNGTKSRGRPGPQLKPTDNPPGLLSVPTEEPKPIQTKELTTNHKPITSNQEPEVRVEAPAIAVAAPPADDLEIPKFLKRSPNGTRLAKGWQPSDALLAYAAEQGCADPKSTLRDFAEHFWQKAGRDATSLDWSLRAQRWCRNEKNFRKDPRTNGFAKPVVGTMDHNDASLWRQRLKGYSEKGFWVEETWGPPPESGRSHVPAAILAEWRQ